VFPALEVAAEVAGLAEPAVVLGAAVVDDELDLLLLHAAPTMASTPRRAAVRRRRPRDNFI